MSSTAQLLTKLMERDILVSLQDGNIKLTAPDGQVTQGDIALLREHKEEIIQFLSTQLEASTEQAQIKRIDREPHAAYPLSFAQQRLWLIDQLQGQSAEYHMPFAFDIQGEIRVDIVSDILTNIIARHEILRTTYVQIENEPRQVIRENRIFPVDSYDLSTLDSETQTQQLEEILTDNVLEPFDLTNDVMLRASYVLLKRGSETKLNQGVLIFCMHHIASDGWSMEIVANEFFQLYKAKKQGLPVALPELNIQYVDYAQWQLDFAKSSKATKQLQYWERQLADIPLVHNIPLDNDRPKVSQHQGAEATLEISDDILKPFLSLAAKHQLTPFMLLHSVLALLVSRYSNDYDVVFGTPVVNRPSADLESLIGFFVNSVVLRTDLTDKPLSDYLSHIREVNLDALANQDVPLDHIIERLSVERKGNHLPLFQLWFTLEEAYSSPSGDSEQQGGGLNTISQRANSVKLAKFDLHFHVNLSEQRGKITITYDTALFNASRIQIMCEHFKQLLESFANAQDSSVSISQLAMLTDKESLSLQNTGYGKYLPLENTPLVYQQFEQQVAQTPNKIAISCGDVQLTYKQLDSAANCLAGFLVENYEIRQNSIVALYLERSVLQAVAIIGTMKAGAAYVPVDPELPHARITHILEDCDTEVVLCDNTTLAELPAGNFDSFEIDELLTDEHGEFADFSLAESVKVSPEDLAYVIYTSGSTGTPKGVMVSHQALNSFSEEFIAQLVCVTPELNGPWLWLNSYVFDASLKGLVAIFSGVGCVMANEEEIRDPKQLLHRVKQHEITILNATPTLLREIVPLCSDQKLHIISSAEAIPSETFELISEYCRTNQTRFFNAYGPTEAVVNASFGEQKGIQHIGQAAPNTQLLVLDKAGHPVAPGNIGMLHIGGLGLADGYLNKPEQTDNVFIKNPFYDENNPISSKKLYITGDLVRVLATGELQFVCREDNQIKLRGRRIELDEVSTILNASERIKQVQVLAVEEANTLKISAYIEPNTHDLVEDEAESQHLIGVIKELAASSLPSYMQPSDIILVSQWPMTAGGKLDTNALKAMKSEKHQTLFVAPRTHLEQLVAEIWQTVLGVETVSCTDSFFQLGGHSLMLIRVLSMLREQGFELGVQQIFAAPTVAQLAKVLSQSVVSDQKFIELSAAQIPEMCQRVKPEMLDLVSLSSNEIDAIADQIPGGHQNIQDIYPLAPHQEGILFHHLYSPSRDPYILPSLYQLHDPDYAAQFIDMLNFIIERHDVLRTAFFWQNLSQPVQVVCRMATLNVEHVKLGKEYDTEDKVKSFVEQAFERNSQTMDLNQPPLLRVQHIESDVEEQNYLLVQLHHIISDHYGYEVILQELAAFEEGRAVELAKPIPYRHHIANIMERIENSDVTGFFKQKLANLAHTTKFATEAQGDSHNELHNFEFEISGQASKRLRSVAKALDVSPAAIFHSAWAMTTSTFSTHNDIVFGTVTSGRLQGSNGADSTIGSFINTLPVRVQFNDNTAPELVIRVHDELVDLLGYEFAPLKIAKRCADIAADDDLFTSILNYRHANKVAIEKTAKTRLSMLRNEERTNYPLYVAVTDYGDDFVADVQISHHQLPQSIADNFEHNVSMLVNMIAQGEQTKLCDINWLPDNQVKNLVQIGQGLQDTTCLQPVFSQFYQQYKKTPDAVAVQCRNEQVSYSQLYKRACSIASCLQLHYQVDVGDLVGVVLDRRIDMLATLLAVFKLGAGYVPLDPSYPATRLQYMIDDAQLSALVTVDGLSDNLSFDSEHTCDLSNLEKLSLLNEGEKVLTRESLLEDCAYIIYTSGSTGKPKGTILTQRNVANFLASMGLKPGIDEHDRLLAVTSISFDIHVLELFLPLVNGARVVLADNEQRTSGTELRRIINQSEITIMQSTPSTWEMVLEGDWQPIHPLKALCGGEALSQSLANRLLNCTELTLWNMYGPTETCVWSCTKQIVAGEPINIGAPINNTDVFVLNEQHQLVPELVPGELYIGGMGLANGYKNLEQMSSDNFSPFLAKQCNGIAYTDTLYRTGDIVKRLENGELQFIGRVDHQVKIRGHRIELSEIQNVIEQHEAIEEAVVVPKQRSNGSTQLVSYIKAKQEVMAQDKAMSLFFFGESDIQGENKYRFYLDTAKFADQAGFKAIWTPERHFSPLGALYPNPALLNAALATVTKNIELRAGSVVLPLHDTLRVAEEWAIVDNLSNGRIGVAIASGWHPQDFVLAQSNYADRKQCMFNEIETLKHLWEGGMVSRPDGNGNTVDIGVYPRPISQTLPMWLTAAGNPDTFIAAGKSGANLVTHLLGQSIDELRDKIDLYRQARESVGLDPKQGVVTVMVHTYLGENLDDVIEEANVPFKAYMKSHIQLLLPLFTSQGYDVSQIQSDEFEQIAEFAYRRLVKSATLIGTVESVSATAQSLYDAGIDEISCLIDWMSEEQAEQSLPYIAKLKERLANREKVISGDELQGWLVNQLPGFMVPQQVNIIDQWPTTANGKIDINRLIEQTEEAITERVYIAPQSDIEHQLCNIWQHYLNVEQVSMNDNFFGLGGDSIRLITMSEKVNDVFKVSFTMQEIFEFESISAMAKEITQRQTCIHESTALEQLTTVTESQSEEFIF